TLPAPPRTDLALGDPLADPDRRQRPGPHRARAALPLPPRPAHPARRLLDRPPAVRPRAELLPRAGHQPHHHGPRPRRRRPVAPPPRRALARGGPAPVLLRHARFLHLLLPSDAAPVPAALAPARGPPLAPRRRLAVRHALARA